MTVLPRRRSKSLAGAQLLLEDDAVAMQGDAVAVAFPFGDGISAVWLPPLELLLLLLLLLLLALDSVHGGTISVVMLLLEGTTSWFWGVCPELACAAGPPPGVTRIVLAGGGEGGGALLLLELLLLLLLELLELLGVMHGWTATVSVSEPGGMTISLEPGGTAELPDWTTCASEQGGTAIFSAVFCWGTWTVRMPGSINAVDTASELDELLPPLLPPRLQPVSPREAAATAPMSHLPAQRRITISVSSRLVLPARRRLAGTIPRSRSCGRAGLTALRPISGASPPRSGQRQLSGSWFSVALR